MAGVVNPDTLISEDTVEFTLAVCEGPIAGPFAGAKSFYLGDTPLVSPSGTNNFSEFRVDVFNGTADATKIYNELGGITSNAGVNVTLAKDTPVTRTTSPTLRNLIDVIEVRLLINQLMSISRGGDQREDTTLFKLKYRQAGAPTWKNLYANEVISLKGKTSGGFVKEFRIPVPRVDNDWEIQLTKLSDDDHPTRPNVMTWESFQSVTRGGKAYDNLVVFKGLARASDQFSSIPEFSGVWSGKLVLMPNNYNPKTRFYSGVWDGTFVLGHTDNPAWCAYDVLMNPVYGAKRHLPELLVDRFTFYEGARWCDELVQRGGSGTFQPRYTYNDLIDQARDGLDLARYIVGLFGGILTSDLNNTVRLKIDKPGSVVQTFGLESVTPSGFAYQFSDVTTRANDLTVTFINPDLNWAVDVRRIYDDPLILRNGRIPADFVAVGCIDVYEAQRRAFNMLLKANTETTTVNFQTARQGMLLDIFDLISISDPDMNWGLSGRVKSVSGATITLRDRLTVPVATDMDLVVQTPTGPVPLVVRSSSASTLVLTVQGAGVYPSNAPDRAQFTLSSATIGLAKPFRIIGISPDTSNPEVYNITALEFNSSRFGDVDSLINSDHQAFNGSIYVPVNSPVITGVSSGLANQIVGADGTVSFQIAVEFSTPPPAGGRTVVFYRQSDGGIYQSVSGSTTEIYLPNLQAEVEYEVFAITISATGEKSPPSPTVLHTVSPRVVVPETPTGWTATSGFDTITLIGPAHPDVDFRAFRIYGATAASATLVYLDTMSTTRFVRHVPAGDAYTRYKVTAVNRVGTESLATSFITVVPVPPSLTELDPSVATAIDDAATSSDAAALAALTSASDAATSAGQSADSATEALDYRNTAARMGGGASKNPVFNDWTGSAPDSVFLTAGPGSFSKITAPTVVRYVNAVQLTVPASPASAGPSVKISSLASDLLASRNPGIVLVTAEVEYVSGSLAGAALLATWVGAATYQKSMNLAPDLVAEVGRIQTVQWQVERPVGYVSGGANEFSTELWASTTVAGGALSQCVVRVHRLDFEVITANSMTSIFQQSTVKIDGIASAVVGLRAIAGGGGATLELVALDDPVSGPVSTARISADNIVLDGSVSAAKLNTTSLGVAGTGIFGGLLKSSNYVAGVSGWRISNSGTAEFKNLVARDWIQDGAVSDEVSDQLLATQTIADTSVNQILALVSLPVINPGNIWRSGVSIDIRRATVLGAPGNYSIAREYRRKLTNETVYSAWYVDGYFDQADDAGLDVAPTDNVWAQRTSADGLVGAYDAYQYRLRLVTIPTGLSGYSWLRRASITFARITK